MYKNFNLTESEREQILGMHQAHGYKKPLNEQPATNINPKNLKFGDRGEDVKQLQQALMDKKFLRTTSMKPTGYFGDMTKAALDRAMGVKTAPVVVPTPQTTKTGGKIASPDFGNVQKMAQDNTYVKKLGMAKLIPQEKVAIKSGDYLMIIAFPQYEPKVDKGEVVSWVEKAAIMTQTGELPKKGTYGKIGHAGVALISKLGNVKLFEFGRYNTEKGKGRVIPKSLGKIAKIDSSGKFTNATEVAKIVKANTQGEGPRLQMVTAIVPVPSLQKAIAFAEGPAIREYEAVDMKQGGSANCGTFAIDTAKAGGVPIGDFCTPMPVKMITKFKDYATEYFYI
jgi:hypothetical protein